MFNFKSKRNFIDVYDFGVELQRLEVYEIDLMKQLETVDGSEVVKIQEFLNRIAFERSRIEQLKLEFDNNV